MSHRARGAARPHQQAPLIAHRIISSLLDQAAHEAVAVHICPDQCTFVEADDVAAAYGSGRRR